MVILEFMQNLPDGDSVILCFEEKRWGGDNCSGKSPPYKFTFGQRGAQYNRLWYKSSLAANIRVAVNP